MRASFMRNLDLDFSYLLFLVVCLFFSAQLHALDNWQVYGALPAKHSLAISHDGHQVAMVTQHKGRTKLQVYATTSAEKLSEKDLGKYKIRSLRFLDNQYILLIASFTQSVGNRRVNKYEETRAFVYNLKTRRVRVLLDGWSKIHVRQSNLGNIKGVNIEKHHVYLPAYSNSVTPQYHLYKVNYKNGKPRRYRRGNRDTIDWVLGASGLILARVDFDESKQVLKVFSYLDGASPRQVYSSESALPSQWVVAVTDQERSLLVLSAEDRRLQKLDLQSGQLGPTLLQPDNLFVDKLHRDSSRALHVIRYKGKQGVSHYAVPILAAQLSQIKSLYPDALVEFVSSSANLLHTIVVVSGPQMSPAYYKFSAVTKQLSLFSRQYPQLDDTQLGEVETFGYEAGDQPQLALLTLPRANKVQKRLPLVVLVPGFTAAQQAQGFDWWSQYVASEGFLVLRPFINTTLDAKGESSAISNHLMHAAFMEGVDQLVQAGLVDSDRVCIIGVSVGSVAALQSAIHNNSRYRCVISVNGLSDMKASMEYSQRLYGRDNWVSRYWQAMFGNVLVDTEMLSLSPINRVSAFDAPVLLVHARDDTVVPYRQSKRFYDALRKAGKTVQFLSLDDEDHWLSRGEMRQLTLKTVGEFLQRHNPAH